jgi:lysophospholipase L1-like esterase
MKKILFFILLIVSIQSFGQPTGFQKRIVNERLQGGFIVDSLMVMPRFTDTTQANLHKRFDTCGAYFFSYTKDSVYYRACNPKRWICVGSGSGSGSGIDSLYADTTFHKVSAYTADQKRGNVLGEIYSQTTFTDLDTFTVNTSPYKPATISNLKILLGKTGTDSASLVTLKRYTALDRWTMKAGFIVGDKSSISYGFGLFMYSVNTTFAQDVRAQFTQRTTPGYDGYITIDDGNHGIAFTTRATSATNVIFSVGDSIEFSLNRNKNIFTATARNVTTGNAEVSVSYVYTGLTTAVNTGSPGFFAVGNDSVYHYSFYSDESTGADLMLIGDSKFTWYGNAITQSIPNLLYAQAGNVINTGKSGDKTAEVLLTLDEMIALNPRQALVTIGSNDIRNGVSEATYKANIDTIYNRLTRNGVDVFFALMYETSVDQSVLRSYLLSRYPTKYIDEAYTATLNCNSCLLADNIHLTAYGNKKWVEGLLQGDKIDFATLGHFYEMKYRTGDLYYPAIGDSFIVHTNFTGRKLNVFREGELQWEADTYEPSSITRNIDTIFFHPPLATGERIRIQSYNQIQWTSIVKEAEPVSPLFDTYTGQALGYSVRLLNSAYSGNCIRVRRSSDNAEQDIGFSNSELDTVTLKSFIGANSAYVKTWYDQSGNGSDATQTTSGNQPRIMNAGVIDRVQNNDGNWIAAIKFDGTDDYLSFTNIAFPTEYSMFMVQKRTSAGVNGAVLSGDPYTGFFMQYNDDKLYVSKNSGAGITRDVADATATYCLLSGFDDASNILSAYKDGSAYTLTAEAAAFGFNGQWNRIGVFAGTQYSNAHISEITLYTSDKSGDRTGIESNITLFFHTY